jgi:small subunit ribosomal protein S16
MIRLARYGAKKKPFYHIVAIDKRRARNAICTEKLGFYHPMEKYVQLNLARVKYWLSTGAKCSETVTKLIKKYESGELQAPKPAKKPKPVAKKTTSEKVEKTTAKKPTKAATTEPKKTSKKTTVKKEAEKPSKKIAPAAASKQEKVASKKSTPKSADEKAQDNNA